MATSAWGRTNTVLASPSRPRTGLIGRYGRGAACQRRSHRRSSRTPAIAPSLSAGSRRAGARTGLCGSEARDRECLLAGQHGVRHRAADPSRRTTVRTSPLTAAHGASIVYLIQTPTPVLGSVTSGSRPRSGRAVPTSAGRWRSGPSLRPGYPVARAASRATASSCVSALDSPSSLAASAAASPRPTAGPSLHPGLEQVGAGDLQAHVPQLLEPGTRDGSRPQRPGQRRPARAAGRRRTSAT